MFDRVGGGGVAGSIFDNSRIQYSINMQSYFNYSVPFNNSIVFNLPLKKSTIPKTDIRRLLYDKISKRAIRCVLDYLILDAVISFFERVVDIEKWLLVYFFFHFRK